MSLENHLYKGLFAVDLFEQDKQVIDEFLGEDRVLHVYGKVRENPFEDAEYGTLGTGHPYNRGEADIIARLTPEGYASQNDHYRNYSAVYNPYYREGFEQAYPNFRSFVLNSSSYQWLRGHFWI